LNDRWRHYASSTYSCIAISQEWGFDLTAKAFFPLADPLRATYVHDIHADEPYFYIDHAFLFPPYEIKHKGEFSYVCSREGHPVWSFRTRGYLYTDMVQYHDAVVFGTAGMGGHFIALRLSDGTTIFDVNTKGTSRYIHRESTFYTYAGGKDGLLAVSLHGTAETLPLPGVTDHDCPLYLDRDRILCLSFIQKKDRYTTVHLNAVACHESKPPVEPVVCTPPIRGKYRLNPYKGYRRFDIALHALQLVNGFLSYTVGTGVLDGPFYAFFTRLQEHRLSLNKSNSVFYSTIS
jgi:hypothetical protein